MDIPGKGESRQNWASMRDAQSVDAGSLLVLREEIGEWPRINPSSPWEGWADVVGTVP